MLKPDLRVLKIKMTEKGLDNRVTLIFRRDDTGLVYLSARNSSDMRCSLSNYGLNKYQVELRELFEYSKYDDLFDLLYDIMPDYALNKVVGE